MKGEEKEQRKGNEKEEKKIIFAYFTGGGGFKLWARGNRFYANKGNKSGWVPYRIRRVPLVRLKFYEIFPQPFEGPARLCEEIPESFTKILYVWCLRTVVPLR